MSVIISTTKGKKERIELAATENAKVCTSVRKRYFTVATIKLGGRRRGDRQRAEGPSLEGEISEFGEVGTRPEIVSNMRSSHENGSLLHCYQRIL